MPDASTANGRRTPGQGWTWRYQRIVLIERSDAIFVPRPLLQRIAGASAKAHVDAKGSR